MLKLYIIPLLPILILYVPMFELIESEMIESCARTLRTIRVSVLAMFERREEHVGLVLLSRWIPRSFRIVSRILVRKRRLVGDSAAFRGIYVSVRIIA